MLNCFVVKPENFDSREGWAKVIGDVIQISGQGGGVGINFSEIRPRGSEIKGTGGQSSGSVSLMNIVNAAAEEIRGGGSRRAALLMALEYNHPDILEFLNAKLDLKKLNNANISVIINDDFINAVKENKTITTEFGGKNYTTYPARDFFNKLIENSLKTGEPGIMNMGLMEKYNNISSIKSISCTNPCGELPLTPYGSCCLGSIVLPRFVTKNGNFNFQKLAETIPIMVRYLDNILDVNNYPLPEIERETKYYRRIGLGVMGIHDMLLLMGYKYTSQEGHNLVDKVLGFIKKKSYEASTYLAVEKGPFPKFNRKDYLENNFIKELSPSLRTRIQEYGIRNSALLTIAPTGTTSIICSCSSGLEPIFSYAYIRRWDGKNGKEQEVVIHPLFEQFVKEGRDVSHFESAMDISPEDHIKMQVLAQQHIDGSISKTINLPKYFTNDQFSDLILKYIKDLKGLTVYRDGSRGESPLQPLSLEEAIKQVGEKHKTELKESKCKSGVCDL
jgi:ribonucleoside-diphosphate reductase alpha chain